MIRVVKVGGRPLGDAAWLEGFASVVSKSAGRVVVVHGGGPEVDALSTRLGIPVERVDGRRVTSEAALDVAAMVLSGRINKRVVAALVGAGVSALGLSGEDGGLLEARVAANGALGRVGEIVRVNASLLRELLALGVVPVLSPISRGEDGRALNVNADDAALAIASALGARELIFLTDVPAVHDGRSDRSALDEAEARELLASGVVRDGMAVKVRAALGALGVGVDSVRIGPLECLIDPAAGTRLSRALEGVA